jgi:hypothetical protein
MNGPTPPSTNSDEKYKWMSSALAGFAGGLAPFAINLAQTLVGNSQLTVKPGISYVIGMLIFGIIGAVVASLFREVDLKKAFLLGISAPAMISLAAKSDLLNSKSAAVGLTAEHQVAVFLIPSAYAQQESPSSSQPINGRILEIELKGTMPAATVVFRDASGKELKSVNIKLNESQKLLVPATATSIVVRYGDSVTNPYPLSPNTDKPQHVQVTGTDGRKDLDIFSAFTGQAKVLYNIQIAP